MDQAVSSDITEELENTETGQFSRSSHPQNTWRTFFSSDTLIDPAKWLPIPGFPSYLVNTEGRGVLSLHGRSPSLLQECMHSVYPRVGLHNSKGVRKFLIHRLVLLAAGIEIPSGMEIDHIDDCPLNYALNNLEVVTRSENQRRRRLNGVDGTHRLPIRVPKRTYAWAQAIRAEYAQGKITFVELAEREGCSRATITNCLTGRTHRSPKRKEYPKKRKSKVRPTSSEKQEIYNKYCSGNTQEELAKEYGCCRSAVCWIIRHIEDGYEGSDCRGENNKRSKLKSDDVLAIKTMWVRLNPRPSQKSIASAFGVSQAAIGYILTGRNWKHIPFPAEAEQAQEAAE